MLQSRERKESLFGYPHFYFLKLTIGSKDTAFWVVGGALTEIGAPKISGGAPKMSRAAQFASICASLTAIGGAICVSGTPEMAGGGVIPSFKIQRIFNFE